MDELELPELYEAAARAAINERCAPAFLHDVRGSMQALFSALELLGRSAKACGDTARIEKACALAKRAISHHEKSTMEVLQLLTLQHAEPDIVDVAALLNDVVHFLRNDAANREVTLAVATAPDLYLSAERAKFQTVLVGLLTGAIDATPLGAELQISAERCGPCAVISIGRVDCYGEMPQPEQLLDWSQGRLLRSELILVFARRFVMAHGGRIEIDPVANPAGALRLYYPCAAPESSPNTPQ